MAGRKSPKPGRRRDQGDSAGRKDGQIIIWGTHACREAIANPDRRITSIRLDRDAPDWLKEALDAAAEVGNPRPRPQVMARPDLQALVPPQAVHQGIVLHVEPLQPLMLESLIDEALARDTALLLVLDQVEDPHNVGAIVRSAAVFGALAIIVQSRHTPPLGGTLFKAACGGCEHVPLVPVTNIARALEALSRAGIATIGLAEQADREIGAMEPEARTAIVLGGEGAGLRRLVAESCDSLVSLPTPGPISTLNVSNAAAVALFHVSARQRIGND